MAEKIEVDLEVKSNLGQSISDLKDLKRQLKETATGSEDFKKIYGQIDDLEDKIKSSKAASSDWVDSLENAGGPLGMLGSSINKAKVATQSFSGALKATGIGLVVALVAGLVAAFQDNESAMKKLQPLLDGMQKIFQGIFRAVEPLFNILVDLALEALPFVSKAFEVVYSSVTAVFQSLGYLGNAVKKLLSGDFSGAWEDAKKSVTSFSDNYDNASKRFVSGTKEMTEAEKEEAKKRAELREKELERIAELEKNKKEQLKTIQDAEKEAIEKRFELEKLSFEQRRKIVNEDKKLSEKDRKDFLDKINSEERKATEEHNKAIADLNLKYDNEAKSAAAITAQEKLDLEMQNKLDEINLIAKTEKEKSDLYDKWNTEYDRKQKELNKNELLNQQSKNLTVANDSSLSFQTRLDAIKAREDAEKDIVFKSKDEQLAYEKANADATEKIEKEKAAARMAYLSAGSTALKNAANLAGEATDTGKALAVAAATIDTYQSAVSSYNSLSGIPMVGPALGAVAAGIAVASGLANVKKILSVKTPKGGGGGGSAPSMGGTMAPQFNVVGATGVNQLAGALSNREQQPVMAYVTANNVTTAQALDRNIITSATLG